LGFIRLFWNPAVVAPARKPVEAAALLAAMVRDPRHVYLGNLTTAVAVGSAEASRSILGSRQTTDT